MAITDLTIDNDDEVTHIVDLYDTSYPAFPSIEMIHANHGQNVHKREITPLGTPSIAEDDAIRVSDNFRYYTQTSDIRPSEFDIDQNPIYLFGNPVYVQDKLHAMAAANEIITTIKNTDPYFIKK